MVLWYLNISSYSSRIQEVIKLLSFWKKADIVNNVTWQIGAVLPPVQQGQISQEVGTGWDLAMVSELFYLK